MTKKIERDKLGIITESCWTDMREHLPIKVYVNNDKEAHKVIKTEEELDGYFKGALPYVLTTRYEYD